MTDRRRNGGADTDEVAMTIADRAGERASRRLARGNPAGLLYGAIITGGVMSATAGHVSSAPRLIAPCLFVLGVYWLADVYVRVFADQFVHGRSPLLSRLRTAARHEGRVPLGGLPALATVVVVTALGGELDLAVNLALWLTVVELGAVGYLAARFVGDSRRTAFGESLAAALLGVLMVVAKSLLH